jgi:eukaryotic-like serine/threonine-protein kinase
MGQVYRARDTRLNRDVAIKVLLPAVANDADRLARFSREAQLLASLNHQNIAHVHGL